MATDYNATFEQREITLRIALRGIESPEVEVISYITYYIVIIFPWFCSSYVAYIIKASQQLLYTKCIINNTKQLTEVCRIVE